MIRELTVYELLPRIQAPSKGNVWSAVVIDDSELEQAVEELKDGIEIFSECQVQNIDVSDIKTEFIKQIGSDTEYVVLWNFNCWNNKDWQGLDYIRYELDYGKHGGIMVLSQQSAESMAVYAPNFSSWIGGRIFQLILGSEILTDEECESRLVTLREWKGLSDKEVIEKAEAHQLPSDPEYGEWLILLDRGDLIGS
jgi:hypothetical protein